MSELTDAKPRPADFVQPDVSEARVQRLWTGVSQRLPSQKRARKRWILGGAFALSACVALALYVGTVPDSNRPEASLLEGAVFETRSDSLNMALGDGSSVRLDSNSRVEVAGKGRPGVELVLRRGRIDCDVKPQGSGSFRVVADGVEVRVVGTLFSVSTSKDGGTRRVEVRVERGVVEVRTGGDDGEVARVKAGNSWSRVTRTAPAPKLQPVDTAPAPAAESPAPSAPAPHVSERVEVAPEGAKQLLERANLLRRQGKVREAANAYEELLAKHSSDGRAGLAAFELGRLRMDRLGDMPGAIRALERAVALAPGSGFREDALARLVTSNERAGNVAGCKRARSRYLQSYPEGVHRQKVSAQCGGEAPSR